MELLRESGAWFRGIYIYELSQSQKICSAIGFSLDLSPSMDVLRTWLKIFNTTYNAGTLFSASLAPKCAKRTFPNYAQAVSVFSNATQGVGNGFAPFGLVFPTVGFNSNIGASNAQFGSSFSSFGFGMTANPDDSLAFVEFYLYSHTPIPSDLYVNIYGEFPYYAYVGSNQCYLGTNVGGNWTKVTIPLSYFGIPLTESPSSLVSFFWISTAGKNYSLSEVKLYPSIVSEQCDVPTTTTPLGFSYVNGDSCSESFATCGTCIQNSTCNWCPGTGCIESRFSSQYTCSQLYTNSCPGSLGPFRCESYSSCGVCVTDARCGWCSQTSTCLSTFSSNSTCPSLARYQCNETTSSSCNGMAFDSLTGNVWNKKLWEGIDRITVDPQPTYTAITNSYSTMNAQIRPDAAHLLVSNKRHNNRYTHAEVLSHNPGFGYGNFSIRMKASNQNVRTAFYLTRDPNLSLQHSLFLFILSSQTARFQADEFAAVSSFDLEFDSSAAFHKYTIERLPTTVSFYANDKFLKTLNFTSTNNYRVGFSIFAQQGWDEGSTPNADGSFTSAQFRDFQYCPLGCNGQCKI